MQLAHGNCRSHLICDTSTSINTTGKLEQMIMTHMRIQTLPVSHLMLDIPFSNDKSRTISMSIPSYRNAKGRHTAGRSVSTTLGAIVCRPLGHRSGGSRSVGKLRLHAFGWLFRPSFRPTNASDSGLTLHACLSDNPSFFPSKILRVTLPEYLPTVKKTSEFVIVCTLDWVVENDGKRHTC